MKEKLASINILSFIINGMVSIRLLSLPRDIVEHAENNGWVSVLLMGGFTFLIGYVFYWIGSKNQGLNFSQICNRLYGRFLGRVIIVGIAIYTIASVGLGVRLFADGIKVFLLDNTPMLLIIFIMILACVYCLLQGVKTISIVSDILLPIILVFITGLILLSLSSVKFMNLRPFFYGGLKPIGMGALELSDPFLTVGIIGYVMPYFSSNKGMKKWIAVGISISIIIYLLIVLMCIMVFGAEEIKYLLFPTITLSKSVVLKSKILERAESLYMAAWVPITFATLLFFYFVSTLNLKTFFSTKRDRIIILAQIPIFLILALYSQNVSEVFKYTNWNERLGQLLMFIVVPLTALIQLIKERRKSSR